MNNILIVEDDISLCDGIALALKTDENQIDKSHNLRTAKQLLNNKSYDLIILDINLPDGSGMDFLKEFKKHTTKIIMLTANDMECDVVSGLENGADDYITKPFSLAILRARVNTQLKIETNTTIYKQTGFKFDFEKMEYFVGNNQIELSKTEQKLLKIFTSNKGITLERDALVNKIWDNGSEYVDKNALSVIIQRLRSKLQNTDCIKTVYGIGYVWVV